MPTAALLGLASEKFGWFKFGERLVICQTFPPYGSLSKYKVFLTWNIADNF